ncbi:hypothetical protein IQ07DRAFT_646419 [Pyrenochaeta sp. DS3sAY3a]|nr:hypothetical protein IQ07DRAFT_646419 [Pyrenochaeta sp. DS3sAY3a]
MAPTSFASAAAGTSANSARADPSGDWARRTNGATQTFRRPSHATTPSGSTSLRDPSAPPNSSSSGVYVPPHAQPGRSGSSIDGRYSRDQLTHLLRTQQDSGDLNDSLSSLYMGSWEPQSTNGASGASWGRKDDQGRDTQSGVDQCWDRDGSILPLSLAAMAHDEKEVFLSSVNSPLKPPAQNANKDGTPKEALSLRKTSVSHGAGAPYGLSSPTTARPGARRRDTGEAYPFPSSPATSRFARDESNTVTPPPALVRRRTDFKDSTEGRSTDEREREKGAAETANPFGSLKRTTTGPFNSGGAGSPWSATPGGGFGAFGNFGNPQPDKKAGYGGIRGESRFKGLMGKQSVEEFEKGPKEKGSISNLGILNESEPSKSAGSWMEARSNRPTSNDTDPFPEDHVPSGSAALHGGDDMSPPRPQGSFGTPHRPDPRDDTGFSAFGMTSDNTGLRDIFHGRDNFAHHTPQRGLEGGHEPMSPTNTNPYQSPDHARNDHDNDSDDSDAQQTNYPGMGSFQIDQANPGMHNTFGGLGGLGRINPPFETAPSDRSQTSSVGPTRGFPSIPGLGGLPGLPGLGGSTAWSSNQQALGTPIRERGLGGFESAFSNVGEAQSPSLAGLGNSALFGPASGLGHGTAGRSSRLGSLFPTAMQDQMRSNDPSRPTGDDNSSFGDRQQAMTGTFGRNAFGGQTPGSVLPNRDTDSPFRANRNLFEDFTGASSEDHNGAPFGQNSGAPQASTLATTSLSMAALNHTRTAQPSTPGVNSPASSQPPAPQQRTMVMPDRMRWIYRDPSGNTQGPFSGLEMHDWYKAGFFSPELLVKKQEEPDYEPLAQLIRRIGNSREPFLVPQIGIPHGPPTAQPGNAWAGAGPTAAAPGAQPPFANSFPSFGTTLTAEQQNALERRKQEEQYLMARQKEHLSAQQLALSRQVQMTGMMPNLNHHSSAQSLQSQPSYGSITSPGGYQPSPTQGPAPGAPVPGLLDSTFRGGQGPVPGLGPIGPGGPGMDILSNLRDEDVPAMMDRLSLGRTGQAPFGAAPPQFGQQQHPDARAHQQQVAAMLNDRARLQREQAEHDNLQRQAPNEQQNAQAFADRLQQFNELRLQTDLEQSIKPAEDVIGKPQGSQGQHSFPTSPADDGMQAPEPEAVSLPTHQEPLSLTEQVQKAASAKHSPQPLSAWNKVEPALFPFPPPPSQSPLPAPAAQRKPIVAENLAGESRSGAATPAADTPSASVAPWAKEPAEASRGPSLREIQEAEAKKAAEREAVAAAARREAFEKELLAHSQSPAIQPGLPSSSTWASGASPITPGGATGSSVWAKPLAGKTVTPSTPNSKKTLQQIQKEEEARKQRVAAQAAAASGFGIPAPVTAAGKRYADLAGKSSPALPPVSAGNSAWTTVGASGKVKTPGGTTPVPTAVRSTSSTIVPPIVKKPAVSRSVTMGAQSGKLNAEEEFRKWAVNELRHDLNKGIIAEDFVSSLLSFPADAELITESVHSASNTLDSRHFAEEFLRRRKLADKGIIDDRNTSSPADNKSAGSGWSEVAKKGGATLQQQQSASSLVTGDFKVVPSKKKTKR